MGSVHDAGTRAARVRAVRRRPTTAFTAELARAARRARRRVAARVSSTTLRPSRTRRLRAELAAQTARTLVHPGVLRLGDHRRGRGRVDGGIADLLPASAGDVDGPVSGTVFKVERGPAGEKIAYVRMFSGDGPDARPAALRRRRRRKVTAIRVFDRGVRRAAPVGRRRADRQALGSRRHPDRRRDRRRARTARTSTTSRRRRSRRWSFPDRRSDRGALHVALTQLAEQDPLIDVRQDDIRQETVRLALRRGAEGGHPGDARGRVRHRRRVPRDDHDLHRAPDRDRGPPSSCSTSRRTRSSPPSDSASSRAPPVRASSSGSRRSSARCRSRSSTRSRTPCGRRCTQGLHGWEVTDCAVAMTHSGYLGKHGLGHQYFNKSMSSTGEDFRFLTPLVLMDALRQAGTLRARADPPVPRRDPGGHVGALVPVFGRLRAIPGRRRCAARPSWWRAMSRPRRCTTCTSGSSSLTRGEGVLENAFDRYEPVTRRRTHSIADGS